MASDDLHARIRRACAEADDETFEELEPYDYQQHADKILAVVQPELDWLREERDKFASGTPLICSDSRHAAKVAALEKQIADWRSAAYKAAAERDAARAERDHLASACRTLGRRLTVLGAALPPGLELYVGKVKAMRNFIANAVADIAPAETTKEPLS